MRIGEIAAAAGVPTATVRYYERRQLLARARRTGSGYREYGGETADRIRFIKGAQELGFTLDEIRELLELRINSRNSCEVVEIRTRRKIEHVRHKIVELERLELALERFARSCANRTVRQVDCPLLEALTGEAAHA